MIHFATLLERLLFAPRRNTKLAWISTGLTECPPADRGWGVAAMAGERRLRST